MILDEVDLMELEDFINHLDETVGLSPETLLDVQKAISKRRSQFKKLSKSDVSQDSEQLPPHAKKGDYCAVCGGTEFWNDENEL